jgi:hypothetical protein
MSAYDNDPRVTDVTGHGALYSATCCPGEGPTAQVRLGMDDKFSVFLDGQDSVIDPELFDTADEAIHSLIGDPQ